MVWLGVQVEEEELNCIPRVEAFLINQLSMLFCYSWAHPEEQTCTQSGLREAWLSLAGESVSAGGNQPDAPLLAFCPKLSVQISSVNSIEGTHGRFQAPSRLLTGSNLYIQMTV